MQQKRKFIELTVVQRSDYASGFEGKAALIDLDLVLSVEDVAGKSVGTSKYPTRNHTMLRLNLKSAHYSADDNTVAESGVEIMVRESYEWVSSVVREHCQVIAPPQIGTTPAAVAQAG